MLDGIQGGNQGVMGLRDGTLRGGDSFFWERKVVTIGFTGTYTDESAEGDGMALAGKQAIRFKSKLRLLIPD
jgi:hypothetical protein